MKTQLKVSTRINIRVRICRNNGEVVLRSSRILFPSNQILFVTKIFRKSGDDEARLNLID